MSARNLLMVSGAASSGPSTLNVNDVFSARSFTGTGAAQSIVTGVDLATHGGMLWQKSCTTAADHYITDTVRGRASYIASNSNAGAATNPLPGYDLSSFDNNGFSLGPPYSSSINTSYVGYLAWTFRKASKFFDVVTWTGNAAAGRQIAHGLGVAPGMVVVKRTGQTGNWAVYHRSTGAQNVLLLNGQNAATAVTNDYWGGAAPTDSAFTVQGENNTNNAQFIAYLFAHDPDGVIQCGSFSIASANVQVDLGWEPQALLVKRADSTGDWLMFDTSRGLCTGTSSSKTLVANTTAAEGTNSGVQPNAAGFVATTSLGTNATFVYVAIRRNNKAPTSGTEVFNATARTGTGATAALAHGFAPDLWIASDRGNSSSLPSYQPAIFTRLLSNGNAYRGNSNTNWSGGWGDSYFKFSDTGVTLTGNHSYLNYSPSPYVYYALRRAPGFFDEVFFTATGTPQNIRHGLGAPPELMIVKCYNSSGGFVYAAPVGAGKLLGLMSNQPSTNAASNDTVIWNNTAPTDTYFSINTSTAFTYSAFLFASLPGVSKIGSYTGNGGSQNIDCGFSAGARFFLVKATSTTGDWWMFDSARGIVSGTENGTRLNSSAPETAAIDVVDPYASGITVNQEATCSINASGVSYIYWAIA